MEQMTEKNKFHALKTGCQKAFCSI